MNCLFLQVRLLGNKDVDIFGNQNHLPCKFVFFSSDKFWYCRLSPNHKVLHYGDLEESPQGEVPHDSLQDKRKWLSCVGTLNLGCLFSFLVTK